MVNIKPIQVLVVDDSPGDVFLTRQALAEEPFPVHVRVAKDGGQALQLLIDEHLCPDLVILDLAMPQMPGLKLLEQYSPPCPIVVFTASDDPDDEHRARKLGATEYVRKPRHFDTYAEQVCRIVRNWAAPEFVRRPVS